MNSIRRNCDDEIPDEVALDLLDDMLTLYIRARSFSYAKDIKANHYINKGKSKATKSLRGGIKNALLIQINTLIVNLFLIEYYI